MTMNEITVDNFEEQFPTIAKNIREAVFLAIDCEFSGLVSAPKYQPTYFDTAGDRYFKQKNSVSDCTILQFGLATFAKDPLENKFQVNYYTFYACQRNVSDELGPRFQCDSFSLEFLAEHDFDFNKWITKGLTFMNKKQENVFKDNFKDPKFMEKVVLDGTSREDNYADIVQQISSYSKKFHEEEDFSGNQILIPFTGSGNFFKNYAILHNLRQFYPMYSIKHVNGHIIVRQPESEEEVDVIHADYEAEENEVIDYMIGLSRVFQVMIESKKPLVGHNVFLDLLYMYQSFHDQLPKSLETFKHDIMEMFQMVYDTKHIFVNVHSDLPVVCDIRSGSNLLKLYESFDSEDYLYHFKNTPSIEVTSHENLVIEPVKRQHDAGFDAYMSGYVFVRMVHGLIATTTNNQLARPSWNEYQMMVVDYANKANLICAQTHSVNLAGNDGPSKRPPWIYVGAKKGILDPVEMKKQLSCFGRSDIEVISNSEVLIASGNFSNVRDILGKLTENEDLVVQVYNKWRHNKFFRTIKVTGYIGSVALSAVIFLKLYQNL